MTNDELIVEIEAQRNLMVAVATGGPRIDSLNAEYESAGAGSPRACANLD